MVSHKFDLNWEDLRDCYYEDTDKHDSESRVRTMWKYAAARTVTGTPIAIINGVILAEWPSSADDWMNLLNEIYDS